MLRLRIRLTTMVMVMSGTFKEKLSRAPAGGPRLSLRLTHTFLNKLQITHTFLNKLQITIGAILSELEQFKDL